MSYLKAIRALKEFKADQFDPDEMTDAWLAETATELRREGKQITLLSQAATLALIEEVIRLRADVADLQPVVEQVEEWHRVRNVGPSNVTQIDAADDALRQAMRNRRIVKRGGWSL